MGTSDRFGRNPGRIRAFGLLSGCRDIQLTWLGGDARIKPSQPEFLKLENAIAVPRGQEPLQLCHHEGSLFENSV